jgi:hypothetical protein
LLRLKIKCHQTGKFNSFTATLTILKPLLSAHSQRFINSISEFFIPFRLFGRWIKQNWVGLALVQISAMAIGILTYQKTPEIILGVASLTPGWLKENHIRTFIENLRDAEMQNRLEDFWRSPRNGNEVNELKNLRFQLLKPGQKKPDNPRSFQLAFELNKAEPAEITRQRIQKTVASHFQSRPEIQKILAANTDQNKKLGLQIDSLKNLMIELEKPNSVKNYAPILRSVLAIIQNQRDSTALRSNVDISVNSISIKPQKNPRPAVLVVLLLESFAFLFFFLRFLWKGY